MNGINLFLYNESESEFAQSCLTLCDPMDCSLPGSSVRGIFQARVLERVAVSFSRRFSQPRDRTQVSHIAGGIFTSWVTREAEPKFICWDFSPNSFVDSELGLRYGESPLSFSTKHSFGRPLNQNGELFVVVVVFLLQVTKSSLYPNTHKGNYWFK